MDVTGSNDGHRMLSRTIATVEFLFSSNERLWSEQEKERNGRDRKERKARWQAIEGEVVAMIELVEEGKAGTLQNWWTLALSLSLSHSLSSLQTVWLI
jgi:hypothetical protein